MCDPASESSDDCSSEECDGSSEDCDPPANLGDYVNWASSRACGGSRTGPYQLRALILLGATWMATSAQTYMLHFVTTKPDVGAQSGRVLVALKCADVSPAELPHCPELPSDWCAPNATYEGSVWEYRDPQNSIRAEFDLSSCSGLNDPVPWVGTLFWLGFAFGVTGGGLVSDLRGRRVAYLLGLALMQGGTILSAVATALPAWAVGRLVTGMGSGSFGMVAFVWCSESLNPEGQSLLTWVPNLFFVLGGCMLAPLANMVKAWRAYSLWVAAVGMPFFLSPLLLYDSPKWLAAKGERQRVFEVMSGITSANGIAQLPPPGEGSSSHGLATQEGLASQERSGLADLLLPKIFVRLVVTSFAWFVLSFSYYGLSMASPPPVFSNSTLSWCWGFALELPAYMAAMYMIESATFGRKLTTAGSLVMGGVFLWLSLAKRWFEDGSMKSAVDQLYYPARMSIAGAFAVVYPWSSELFPANIRNSAMGVNSFCSRMGAMISPHLSSVANFDLRMSCVAGPCVVAGVLSFLFLEETRGASSLVSE